ncbi:MAG: HYR domain-containing protein [Ilumatobacter sp.]
MSNFVTTKRSGRLNTRARLPRLIAAGLITSTLVSAAASSPTAAETAPAVTQFDVVGPAGSEFFGISVTVLTNGNYVVNDEGWDNGGSSDVGAVYLYDGTTNTVISTLTGSKPNDAVGSEIVALSNGNFLVMSFNWGNGTANDVGAVTWVDGTNGLSGTVSAANSLVGSVADDFVGGNGAVELANGNYVVRSSNWNNGAAARAGAVTWGNGTTGVTGEVSAANSLVGSTTNDRIGESGIDVLPSGNYVVSSIDWNNGGALAQAGAVTWGNGTGGTVGPVSAANSLVGPSFQDRVGRAGSVTVLANGNYVVASPEWNNGALANAGAVTWSSGTTPTTGEVSTSNSLYGDAKDDDVGGGSVANNVTALTNGNYVVASPKWSNGAVENVGAVTWGNGTTGTTGVVSTSNSLYSNNADLTGGAGVTALTNGNYVVTTNAWDNGAAINAGAATWGDGTTGISGPITTANSLHGTTSFDFVGNDGTTALSNGNYVVNSSFWNKPGDASAGAVTWGNGATGTTGEVTIANSLYGDTGGDRVGSGGITALTNGNYVAASPRWLGGVGSSLGAATWGDGTAGTTGMVDPSNSVTGSQANDAVSGNGVTPLANGNYVIVSRLWQNGAIDDAGAVTWGDGTGGTAGEVGITNSLVGTTTGDEVGNGGVTALRNGNYVVSSLDWTNGSPASNRGAATWGDGTIGVSGSVSGTNSLIGETDDDFVGTSVVELESGDFVVVSGSWNDGAMVDAGAVTLGIGDAGVVGPVTATNSAIGPAFSSVDVTNTLLTAGDALPVATGVTRVLLLQLDRSPGFPSAPPNVNAATAPGTTSVAVSYTTPTATDVRSTPTVTCAPASGSSFSVGDTTVTCTATDSAGFTAQTSFVVSVTATPAPPDDPPAPDVVSLEPARILETRPGQVTADGQEQLGATIPADSFIEVQVTERQDVPTDAAAAVINVTAINPTQRGFVTLYPCGERPNASSLNYPAAGTVIANEVIAKLSSSGTVCAYTLRTTHLAFDIVGYVPASSTVQSLDPARILETRPGQVTADGQEQLGARIPADTFIEVQVAGREGVPTTGAGAAIINVTAINPTQRGFITLYPCGEQPLASSLNYPAAGTVIANEVIAKLSSSGTVCAYSSRTTHLAFDIVGYIPTASTVESPTPARYLETRSGQDTFDGKEELGGTVAADSFIEVEIAGRGEVPAGATAAIINITAINPTQRGFVTLYPCGDRPLASSLNYPAAGTVIANEVIAKLSATGTVCAYTLRTTHLAFDVVGYVPAP